MLQNVKVSLDIPHGYKVLDYREPLAGDYILLNNNAEFVMGDSPYVKNTHFILKPIHIWKIGEICSIPNPFSDKGEMIQYLIVEINDKMTAIVDISTGKIKEKFPNRKLQSIMNDKYSSAEMCRNLFHKV